MTIINMSGGKPAKPIVVEAVEETPSTLPYTFSPREGVDYLSSVTVGKDPNLLPGNVKQGVTIFGTEGTLTTGGGSVADYVIPWSCNSLPFIPLVEYEDERPARANAPVYSLNYRTNLTLSDPATGDTHAKPYPRFDYYSGPFSAIPIQVDIAQGSHTSLPVGTLWDTSGISSNLAGDIRTSIGQLYPGTNQTELPFTGIAFPVAFCEGTGSSNAMIGWESQPEPIVITGTLGVSTGSTRSTTMTVDIPSDISMLCYCRGASDNRLFMGLGIIDLAFDMGDYI